MYNIKSGPKPWHELTDEEKKSLAQRSEERDSENKD